MNFYGCFFFWFLCLNCFSRTTWYLTLFCFHFWWSKLRMSPHHSKSRTHLKSPSKMQVRLDTWFMLRFFFLKPDVVIFPGQAQQYLSCRCALKTCEKFPTISDCAAPWTNIGHHSRCYVAFFILFLFCMKMFFGSLLFLSPSREVMSFHVVTTLRSYQVTTVPMAEPPSTV